MDLMRTDALRTYAQHRRRARSSPARVVVPLALASTAQVILIGACLATGLSLVVTIVLAVALAVVSATIHRRTVGSLVAGAGIRVAQPYRSGEQLKLFIPSHDGVETAEVVRVGPANTTLRTDDGLVVIPNNRMLRGR